MQEKNKGKENILETAHHESQSNANYCQNFAV